MALSVRPSKNSAVMQAHSGIPVVLEGIVCAPWQEFGNGGPKVFMLLGGPNEFTFSQASWHWIGIVQAHSGVPVVFDGIVCAPRQEFGNGCPAIAKLLMLLGDDPLLHRNDSSSVSTSHQLLMLVGDDLFLHRNDYSPVIRGHQKPASAVQGRVPQGTSALV